MESDDDDGGFDDLPYRVQVAYDATIGTYVFLLVYVTVQNSRVSVSSYVEETITICLPFHSSIDLFLSPLLSA